MAGILRGEVVWADLDPVRGHGQASRRPVVIISHEVFNQRSGTVIAMAVTSQPPLAGYPLTYALPPRLLPKPSWVKITQLRTLSVERLGPKLARLSPEQVEALVLGLNEVVG